MTEEREQLIKEIVRDSIYVIFLIIVTVFASIYIFPKHTVKVQSSHDYICSQLELDKCSCENNKCFCTYCENQFCNYTKTITCKK